MVAAVEKKSDAKKVADLRKMAEDKTLPQAVRNSYLDRANEIERSGYEKMKMTEGMAKGGAVKKKPAMAIMIGVGPAKKMAKGGKVTAPIKEYGGKETYSSKAAMAKHEKKEPMKMEKKEQMAKGGTVKCATGGAVKKKNPVKMAVGGVAAPAKAAPQPAKRNTVLPEQRISTKYNGVLQPAPAKAANKMQTAQTAMANTQQRMGTARGSTSELRELASGPDYGGMAKGGVVKKKPMKGVINKFIR